MQTFLPYPSFAQSAKCLDYRRLGKQRVEARQIYNVLIGDSTGWSNHPAVKMWEGYETALTLYHDLMIVEWISRGYKNTMPYLHISDKDCVYPDWMYSRIHETHRAALLFKDEKYYSQFGWVEEPKLDYFWPTGGK